MTGLLEEARHVTGVHRSRDGDAGSRGKLVAC